MNRQDKIFVWNEETRQEWIEFLDSQNPTVAQTLTFNTHKRGVHNCPTCNKVENIKKNRVRLIKQDWNRSNTQSPTSPNDKISPNERFRKLVETARQLRIKEIRQGKKSNHIVKLPLEKVAERLFNSDFHKTIHSPLETEVIRCLLENCKEADCPICSPVRKKYPPVEIKTLEAEETGKKIKCLETEAKSLRRKWVRYMRHSKSNPLKKIPVLRVVDRRLEEIALILKKQGYKRVQDVPYGIEEIKCLVGECRRKYFVEQIECLKGGNPNDVYRFLRDFINRQNRDLLGRNYHKKSAEKKCQYAAFVEYGHSGNIHIHLAVKPPKGKERKYLKCSERNWKHLVPMGECKDTKRIWESQGWVHYITKGCSAFDDYDFSIPQTRKVS